VAQFTADLNNDGKWDLIANYQVALGNGDGTFTVLPSFFGYQTGQVADWNGDGIPDLFVAYAPSSQIASTGILLGKGDGTFGSLIDVPTTGRLTNLVMGGLAPVVAADMDGDSKLDLVFDEIGNGVAFLANTTPSGFALAATPLSPSSVAAGTSVTSAVNITRSFGFTGNVMLACSGLPTGAACQFTPAMIPSGSNNSTLTVTTMGVAAGSYPIVIQGANGSLSSGKTLTLVVQGTPDFSAGAAPASATVTAGQNASYTVTLTPIDGFSGSVAVSCSGAPAKATCSTSVSSITLDGTDAAPVTVSVTTTAPTTSLAPGAPPALPPTRYVPFLFGSIAALLGLLAVMLRGKPERTRFRLGFAAVVILIAGIGIGCGGGGGGGGTTTPGTPTGTYTLTLTATSGSTSHTTTMQLIVQ